MPAMVQDQAYLQIIQMLIPGGRIIETWPLQGGISAQMTALAYEHPDGQAGKFIIRQPGGQALKQNPYAAAFEYKVLQLTNSLGLATPAPLLFDPSGKIISGPYLVIDFVEGKPDFSPANPNLLARQMADHLARIHSADCSAGDCSFLPEAYPSLPESTRQIHPIFEKERIREVLANAWPIPRRNALALLHGDYWPGNILWRDGVLAAVIDWEDAQRGDPLMDFAISRLDILWIYGIDALDTFSRQYLSRNSLDTTALPRWDLYAALRLTRMVGTDLSGWAAFFQPYGRSDITEHSIGEYYRLFINQAVEKLR
jgi:aminoglycoside phosphotransferase (APT) family kinase protein